MGHAAFFAWLVPTFEGPLTKLVYHCNLNRLDVSRRPLPMSCERGGPRHRTAAAKYNGLAVSGRGDPSGVDTEWRCQA